MKKVVPAKIISAISRLSTVFLDQRGATLIEIALYAALVVIVCISVVASLGDKLQGVFNTIVNSL